MIKYVKRNIANINMRRLILFSCIHLSIYKDTNMGTHYGISIGLNNRQLHLLLRTWDIDDFMGK